MSRVAMDALPSYLNLANRYRRLAEKSMVQFKQDSMLGLVACDVRQHLSIASPSHRWVIQSIAASKRSLVIESAGRKLERQTFPSFSEGFTVRMTRDLGSSSEFQ